MSEPAGESTTAKDVTLQGVGVSPGRVVGPVTRLIREQHEPAEDLLAGEDERRDAVHRLEAAIGAVVADLEARTEDAEGEAAEILEATSMIADDPSARAAAVAQVREHGLSAQRAVWQEFGRYRDTLVASGGYLAARATDLDDVRDRIIATLDGRPVDALPFTPGAAAVLVARDLAPVDTAGLRPDDVLAIVIEQGGPTSHTAILASALGIPAVVACAGALDLADGTLVEVDGETGVVTTATTGAAGDAVTRTAAQRVPDGGGRLADGRAIALLANVGDGAGVAAAVELGAEGVGLFRTELAFLDRADQPTVDEQRAGYAAVLRAAGNRRVVVRTLDAGADKPLPFLKIPAEANPALGVRGYRVAKHRPDVLTDQLTAIARAAADCAADPWVMAPMIATPDEAAEFVDLATQAGLAHAGVMIEVPAAALCAAEICAVVAFVSIGTNDLAQYTMAADRDHGELALLNDPWQPGVLRLVATVASAGRSTRTPVGVCGEAAGDPMLAVVLAGLGVHSLSMTGRRLGAVAARLAGVDVATAERAAEVALGAGSATAARAGVRELLAR